MGCSQAFGRSFRRSSRQENAFRVYIANGVIHNPFNLRTQARFLYRHIYRNIEPWHLTRPGYNSDGIDFSVSYRRSQAEDKQ